jgi:hypothetical protein
VRRDLEDIERQAEFGLWLDVDAVSIATELMAMENAIERG